MIIGPDPDPPLAILQQCIDKIRVDHRPIADKTMFFHVEPVKPSAPGAHPDIPLPVLDDRSDEIAAQAQGILRYILIYIEVVSVIAVEPIPRPKPHKTPPVPQDTGHIALG